MLAQPGDVGADDEAQLQVRLRMGGNGVDREVGVAGAHGQHLQRVPGEHAFDRRLVRFAPVGIDGRVAGAAAHLQSGQRRAHVGRDRRRAQPRHEDAAASVHQAGDGRGHHRARIAQQPAPVAGMVRALAQLQLQVEVGDAARAEEQRRQVGPQPRAVGGDQRIGGQRLALQRAELGQARRAGFFAGLEQPGDVEAQPAAARRHRDSQRRDVDAVLALVVGGAAAVELVAVLGQHPRALAACPRGVLAADDIAVAVHQHRGQGVAFVPLRDQEGSAAGAFERIVEDAAVEAQLGQRRADLLLDIGAQRCRLRRVLANAADGDAPRQLALERTAVDTRGSGGQRRGAGLEWIRLRRATRTPAGGRTGLPGPGGAHPDLPSSVKCSTTGGDAKKGPTMARHWANSGPPRKPTVWSSSVSQKICSR